MVARWGTTVNPGKTHRRQRYRIEAVYYDDVCCTAKVNIIVVATVAAADAEAE